MAWIAASVLVLAFVLALFALAWWSDRHVEGSGPRLRAATYGLSIAVYTGSIMYLSGVGLAARSGWIYLTGYIGAALAVTLMFPVMLRMASIVKRENIVSIADFLSSRYGKSRIVGVMVASLALVCGIPFLAQQLRGVAMEWSIVAHTPNSSVAVLVFAATLAGFVILFGARHPTLTEHNRGLVRVIAVESLVKFAALAAIAIMSVIIILSMPAGSRWTDHLGGLSTPLRFEGETFNIMLMGLAAMFCAPRQFYVGFVHLENLDDLRRGRWLFLAYLAIGALAMVPIVIAGTYLFNAQGREMFSLLIPLQFGRVASALTFLGAFSCIAGPVMAETVALSAMVSNELVLPLITRAGWYGNANIDMGKTILRVRRGAICGLLVLAWLYAHFMRQNASLSSMGTVTGAGVMQFLPVLLGGLYWRRGNAAGAIAGLFGGFAVWLYAIASPQFLNNFGMVYHFGIRLSATAAGDMTAHKVFLSLLVNIVLYVSVSLAVRPRLIDRIQAAAFMGHPPQDGHEDAHAMPRGTVKDIKTLVAQFLGPDAAARAFEEIERNSPASGKGKLEPVIAREAERMLAGMIGASLAHRVMGWHLTDGRWETTDMFHVLNDAARAVQFNRELLQATLDHMNQAVYVADRDGLMVAWNRRYIEMFHFPPGFVRVGQSVRETIGFSLSYTAQSKEEIERYVDLRLAQMRHGIPHDFERTGTDGVVLKILGSAMPGGRYVTSYTDVTELRRAATALQEVNERLEQRVSDRTGELAAAKAVAERTSRSQGRFLAAASHDVLQPLQAARLFIGTALEDRGSNDSNLGEFLHHADLCIESADRLLRAILNLSRLEVGGLKPEVKPVDVWELLTELQREFEGDAREKSLFLRVVPSHVWVQSDASLLRSVLQNLLSNAIRYTKSGGVLVGCRNDASGVRFEIRDSGPGIPAESRSLIFGEFVRLPEGVANGPGAGLGLSIVERVCQLLGHPLKIRSSDKGSVFTVCVPRAEAPERAPSIAATGKLPPGLRVLYVENETYVLQSMEALLTRMGAMVSTAASFTEAVALKGDWDVILADYHLDEDGDGIDLIEAMSGRAGFFALLTANSSEEMAKRAARFNIEIIQKPVSALFLRTFLARAGYLAAAVA